MLTLPLNYKTTLIQNYSPFLSRMTKGKSSKGRHLIITGKDSILIIITIIICQSLWRRRWRGNETTKASLLLCYTTDTGVHLTHLISERVKASIHALKLHHDGLQGQTSCQRRSRGRRSRRRRSYKICVIDRLRPWSLQSKLGLTSLNKTSTDGTHGGEIRRIKNGDRDVAKDPRDS